VGAKHRGDTPVQQPAHGDLLARRLGVHVDEDVIDPAAQLAERGLDLGKRGTARAQVQVPAEVDDAEAHSVALDHARAVAGLDAQEVRWAQDPRLGVQIRIDLAAMVGVVAERDRIDSPREQLLSGLRRDSQAARDVLAVDHHEGRVKTLSQQRQAVEQRAPADASDEIPDEEDSRPPTRSPADLRLSHTLAMAGGR